MDEDDYMTGLLENDVSTKYELSHSNTFNSLMQW